MNSNPPRGYDAARSSAARFPLLQYSSLFACWLGVLLLGGCAAHSTSAAPHASSERGILLRSLSLNGQTHRYAIYIPATYDPATPTPTILFLHGSGECGTDGQKQAIVGLGSAAMLRPADYPCIIIFPQKPDSGQEWEAFDALVMATLEETRRELNCDPRRLYLTGLSQGGHGTWTIASLHPDLFAALAPVCAYGPSRRTPTPGVDTDPAALAKKIKHLPIWAFHGEKDSVVPVDASKTMIVAIKAAQSPADPAPKLTLFADDDHNSWDNAYRNSKLGDWLLTHAKR